MTRRTGGFRAPAKLRTSGPGAPSLDKLGPRIGRTKIGSGDLVRQGHHCMEGLFVRAHKRVRPGYWSLAPGQTAPAFRLRVRTLPRYLVDRVTTRRTFKRQTEVTPWIPADALQILEGLLQPTDVGVEFGSGGSTTWFASRV